MIRLQVKPAFAALLQAHDLGNYRQLMQTSKGRVVEEDSLRDVRCLDLDGQAFYLKRTHSEKALSALESYGRGRLAHSKPFKEMLQFKHLARLGFDVAEIVATGEELHYGIPQRGFIMTREVEGRDLALVYRAADDTERCHILRYFGSLLGRLHAGGFYGSTRLKDIIYAGVAGDSPKLTLIDRETRNPYPKRATAKRVTSRLLFNIRRQAQQGEVFSEREWHSFCEAYCQSLSHRLAFDPEALLASILAMLERMGKHVQPG
ncbi:MAG: hypothetical protein GY815_13960 [Gammaproteobacteria bacterium]|nr:hypothetical protein [Gammaproteobacteria bacterium]